MKHLATDSFWKCYNALPEVVRTLADDSHRLLESNPRHPSLHLKKVGRFWSVRIGLHYRALAIQDNVNIIWFWIGSHPEYDRLLGR